MSLRHRLVFPIILSALAVLVGCSSSNKIVPPPGGGFSDSSLKGTYVFSTFGTDVSGAPITIVGSFQADGSGGIAGGTIDANDPQITPVSFQPINGSGSSSYKITADGRGQAKLVTATALGAVTIDFVLASTDHGSVTEFDGNGTGSGTLDLQGGTVTQGGLGSYAFSLTGIDGNSNALLTIGAFSLGGTTTITGGVEDFNDSGFPYASQALTGTVTLNSDGATGTAQLSSTFGVLAFDFYAIDASHLKMIETDVAPLPLLSGDAFAQGSATIPASTLSFVLAGFGASGPIAAGGLMASGGSGTINTSSEDANNAGTSTQSPITFSGSCTFTGPRALLQLPGFFPGSTFAAYPSTNGGLLLLEIDSSGALIGSALPQTSTTLAASQGYGLNLTGQNISASVEVDDIAEFTASSATSSPNMSGLIDENEQPVGSTATNYGQALSGTYAVDGAGRGTITVPNANIVNGGFGITFYPTDGSTFLFIENDGCGQVAAGTFAVQTSPAQAQARRAYPHIAMLPPKVSASAAWRGQKGH